MRTLQTTGLWLAMASILAALDQATKAVIEASIGLGTAIPVTPFFNLVHTLNPGAAFSFLATQSGWQRFFFAAIAIIACVVLTVLIARKPRPIEAAAYTLILGGAAGNLIDRIVRGAVVDWLDFYVTAWHWPAFNLADVWIVLGVGLYILADLKFKPHSP
jgi:signal peptidase II